MLRSGLLATIAGLAVLSPPASAEVRRVVKEAVIAAPRHDVFTLWTTADGVRSMVPEQAKIELKPGGAYEWYMTMKAPEGQRGSEGCSVLFYIPDAMLAFTWNAPPTIKALRDAGARTQVFVRFEETKPGQTKLSLTQVITETGPDWDAYYKYFDRAWGYVVDKCKAAAETPGRTPAPAAPLGVPPLVQTADYDVPADRLFAEFTEPERAKKWLAPQVDFEIKLGGKYRANYDRNSEAAATTWINRDIVGLDPGRLLAVKMTQAPANFPHRAAIERTWHLMEFIPLGDNRSRLRLTMAGMSDDDASRRMREYFEKANPQVFERLRKAIESK